MGDQRAEAVARLAGLVDTLRRECPWDAEQTHTSLRPHLLEEAYEVLEALDGFDEATGDGAEHLEEELGDLLFQVVFHARIAADAGRFDLGSVADGIHDKLRHRHPHVFGPDGGAPGGSADDVVANWDRIKQAEKGRQSVLDGIPAALPALAAARKVARRSAGLGVGPDAPADGPADAGALGEALFGLVEWARRHDLDAEDALRATVAEFSAGVRAAEAAAIADGVDLATADEDTRRTYHIRSRAARDF